MQASKTLIDRVNDRCEAEAFYKLFPDDEHRQAVIHACQAGRTVVRECRSLGRVFPEIEGLTWPID